MKFLKYFSLIVLSLIILIIFSLGFIWFNLGVILTDKNISKIQKRFVPDLDYDWSKLNIQVTNQGYYSKNIVINNDESCFKYKRSFFCIDKMILEVSFRLSKSPEYEVKQLVLISSNSEIYKKDFIKEDKSSEEDVVSLNTTLNNTFEIIKSSISHIPSNYVLDIKKFKFFLEDEESSLPQSLNLVVSASKSQAEIKVSMSNSDQYSLDAKFEPSLKDLKTLDLILKVKQEKVVGEFRSDFMKTDLINMTSELDLKIVGEKKSDEDIKVYLPLIASFDINKKESKIYLKSDKVNVSPYFSRFSLPSCTLNLKENEEFQLGLACRKAKLKISKSFLNKEVKLAKERKEGLPLVGVNFDSAFLPKAIKTKVAKVNNRFGWFNLDLIERVTDLYKIKGDAELIFIQNASGFEIVPQKFSFFFDLFSFQTIVKELKDSKFAIPAPFNNFKGRAQIVSNGLQINSNDYSIPLLASLNLTGDGNNKVDLSATGIFKLPKKKKVLPELNLDILVDEAYLHLPPLDPLRGVPKLTGDSRIVITNDKLISKKSQKRIEIKEKKNKRSGINEAGVSSSNSIKKPKSPINYQVNVKVKNKDSVRLFYDLFKPYYSLGFDVSLNNEGLIYRVNSPEKWSVKYLKREVVVQKANLNKKKRNADYVAVDARLLYKASDYDIFIDVIGSLASPVVKLSSNPSLSRSDIISVLIYNRTADDLNRFESESVGGAQAAITDKALGLFGIWAFASTPIESVSYDSRNRIYRAVIDLPGGVKFDIGTDWERVQNLSLRKRLSEYWVFVTSFEPGADGEKGLGNLFLQREWTY